VKATWSLSEVFRDFPVAELTWVLHSGLAGYCLAKWLSPQSLQTGSDLREIRGFLLPVRVAVGVSVYWRRYAVELKCFYRRSVYPGLLSSKITPAISAGVEYLARNLKGFIIATCLIVFPYGTEKQNRNPCLFSTCNGKNKISSLQVLLGAKPPLKPRWCYLKLSMVPPASTTTRIYINCSVVPDSTLCLGMQGSGLILRFAFLPLLHISGGGQFIHSLNDSSAATK
jgi:hypothetical protein